MAILAGSLLLFVTFSISYSILTRASGVSSPVWIVQFNEYALLWITFLGTAWVLARDKHVSIDLLTGRLSPGKQCFFKRVHGVLGILVCLVLVWYGTWVTLGQFERGVTDVQAIDVPKYLVLMIIPLGFFLVAVQFLRQFLKTLKTCGKATDDSRLEQDQAVISGRDPQ